MANQIKWASRNGRREFQNPSTGEWISRRQYEKIRHAGVSIEARGKARETAGLKRQQAPRRDKGFFRAAWKAFKQSGGLTPKPRKPKRKLEIRPEPFLMLDANGNPVWVSFTWRGAREIGAHKYVVFSRVLDSKQMRTFVGADGKKYYLPSNRKELKNLFNTYGHKGDNTKDLKGGESDIAMMRLAA